MLFHSEMQPNSGIYHTLDTIRVRVVFEANAMEAALALLAKRHPMLRTGMDFSTYSEPLQLVFEAATIPLEVCDLQGQTAQEQAQTIDDMLRKESRRWFDARKPPLLRTPAHLRSEETFQLTLSFHHAILDGVEHWQLSWSSYSNTPRAILTGKSQFARPAPSAAYRDFIFLENESVSSSSAQRYWREKLHGATMPRIGRVTEMEVATGQRGGWKHYLVNSEVSIALEENSQRGCQCL